MRRFALVLIASFLLVVPAYAQDSYTIPADLPRITPENAAHLTQLASVGGKLSGTLAWSPDGVHLAVSTSEDVQVFDVEQPDQPLTTISGGGKVAFDGNELVYDGQLWDISTGKSLGKMPSAAPAPKYSPSGNIQVFLEGSILQLKHRDGSITKIAIETKNRYRDIVFSPDEHYAALIMEHDGEWGAVLLTVQLWNIETGKFISDLPQMLETIDTVAFHAGGAILVTATSSDAPYGISEDLKLWNGRTGQPIELPYYGHLPLRFSPDGRLLAFYSGEGASLWTDHELGQLKFETYNDLPSLVFSPDSRTLVTPSNRRILLWDVSDAQVPNAPAKALQAESDITKILFSPDGSLLVSTESGNIAELWDIKNGTRRARLEAPEYIYTVDFSTDGSLLRSDGYRISLMWDTVTGEKRLTMPSSAILNKDWSKAAYWGIEGGVHVADTASGKITDLYQITPYLGKTGALSSTTGRAFFVGNDLRGYDLNNGDLFFQQSINTGSPWTAFNANGSFFLTGRSPTIYGRGDPAVIEVWDSANLSQPVNTIKIPEGGVNRYMSLNPDGKFLSQLNTACGDGGGGDFQLWDAQNGKQVFSFHAGDCGPYDHIFTPDGKFLLVAWDMIINVIDMATVVNQASTENGQVESSKDSAISYRNHIKQIALSPDGTMLAVSISSFYPESDEPPPEPWIDIVKLAEVMKPGNFTDMPTDTTVRISNATRATFSPDNAFVLTENGLYDAKTGDLLSAVSSKMAAFSPDSKTLVTVDDQGFQLWDVAALAKGNITPLAAFPDQTVQEMAFSPDGTKLYIRHLGDVQVWGISPVS